MKLHILLFTVFVAGSVFAGQPDDPVVDSGESFSHFIYKITKEGRYSGLQIKSASPEFFKAFVSNLQRGKWVQAVDRARADAVQKGADFWGDWYKTQKVLDVVFPNAETREKFFPYLIAAEKSLSDCNSGCRTPEVLQKTDWVKWTRPEIAAFTVAFVQTAPIFNGKTIVEHLGEVYDSSAADAIKNTDLRILGEEEFRKAVYELGDWSGPIYFRAATLRDPKNPERRIILLNSDLMRKISAYDQPFLQLLEFSGILTHETSHVYQDQKARSIGIAELEVQGFEQLMLLEGSAEYLAEVALKKAAATQTEPSALKIFTAEVAQEVVYRKTNDMENMPYSVGLPFAAALFEISPENIRQNLLAEVLHTIQGSMSFEQLLQGH